MAITASPSSKTFSSITHGTTASQTITLTPDATGDSIHGVSIAGVDKAQFTVTETFDVPQGIQAKNASTIVTGGSAPTFTVTYAPAVAGTHSAVVKVHHNAPGGAATTEIPVSGTAS